MSGKRKKEGTSLPDVVAKLQAAERSRRDASRLLDASVEGMGEAVKLLDKVEDALLSLRVPTRYFARTAKIRMQLQELEAELSELTDRPVYLRPASRGCVAAVLTEPVDDV